MDIKMENREIEKGKVHNIGNLVEYSASLVLTKSILSKPTGNINAFSLFRGATLAEKAIPFDTFVQIIDGKAEIIINGVSNYLDSGESIIVPAHASNRVNANEAFKMITTIIKCGYD
jgi:quercetin dioxygenase-like cupin family protein